MQNQLNVSQQGCSNHTTQESIWINLNKSNVLTRVNQEQWELKALIHREANQLNLKQVRLIISNQGNLHWKVTCIALKRFMFMHWYNQRLCCDFWCLHMYVHWIHFLFSNACIAWELNSWPLQNK